MSSEPLAVDCVFFDVAGTLLCKDAVPVAIARVLADAGSTVDLPTVARRHKLLSEAVIFPPETTAAFYREFNAQLLRTLGVPATPSLVDAIYEACRGLPWEVAPGAERLGEIQCPIGILSNWDRSLRERVSTRIGAEFFRIVGSADVGVAKPDPEVFRIAPDGTDVDPSRVVYIGDSIRLDYEPARAAGWNAVLVDPLGLYPAFPGRRAEGIGSVVDLLVAGR